MCRRVIAVALAVTLATAACGGSSSDGRAATVPPVPSTTTEPTTDTTTGTTAPPTSVDEWPSTPPPVVFETADGRLERQPFTVCWTEPADPDGEYVSYCADGMPEDHPPVVAPTDGRVTFTFPVTGWEFSAGYRAGGGVSVEQIDGTTWELVVADDAPGGPVVVSGFGPQGDVHVAVSLPGPAEPGDSARECVAARDVLRDGLPAYDDEPAVDMVELVDRVDAVVLGTIDGLREEDGSVQIFLADARTWGGDTMIDTVRTDGRLDGNVDALSGVDVIAFVHRLDDGTFGVDVQGLHLGCPGGVVYVVEPLPPDPRIPDPAELSDLIDVVAERKAPLDPAGDVHGVGMEPPAAIEVGEVAPVQIWATCSSGVVVSVGDDRYVPGRELAGVPTTPGRAWERTDFPADWEVIIDNEAPVDGDDWVILDAVASRIDTETLEVGHVDGDVIGTFVLDTTPPDERTVCG